MTTTPTRPTATRKAAMEVVAAEYEASAAANGKILHNGTLAKLLNTP
jgi:hypothetical protein